MSKGKILVFETDEDYRSLLEIHLGDSLGYSIQLVSSAQACFYAVETFEPDILLLALEGLGFYDKSIGQIIVSCDENAIPIIVLRNFDAIGGNANYLWQPETISKPFDVKDLTLAISKAIEKRRNLMKFMNKVKKILIIEPDEEQGKFFTALLSQKGYYAKVTAISNDALKLISNESFDLIIMDESEEYDDIRQHSKLKSVPIIELVASDLRIRMLNSQQWYIDYYLTRPIDIEELLARIPVAIRISHELF